MTENFGFEDKGETLVAFAKDKIYGAWFSCPEAGTADNITIYLYQGLGKTPKIKCAIYKKSDNSLVGSTEEWTITSGWDDWKTFDITSGGTLEADDYYLVVWNNDAVWSYYTAETDKSAYDSQLYGSWPDPWNPVTDDKKYSIYCTYTPTPAAPAVGGVLAQII